eukprot:4686171-Prymnesium_polylepis.1
MLVLATSLLATASLDELLTQATALRKSGALAEAEALLAEARQAHPAKAEPSFLLGMTNRGQGRPAEAITHYRESLALSPRMAEAHMNLASLYS